MPLPPPDVSDGLEVRFQVEPDLQAADPMTRRLEGYALVYGVTATIQTRAGAFQESFAPGACTASLAGGADVRLLVEHQPALLLARSLAGNLVLSEDSRGVHFRAGLPDTQLGRDTFENVRVGNYRGMSFGFAPLEMQRQTQGGRAVGVVHRTVTLREITITALPYYPETSVATRSRIVIEAAAEGSLDLRLRALKARLSTKGF